MLPSKLVQRLLLMQAQARIRYHNRPIKGSRRSKIRWAWWWTNSKECRSFSRILLEDHLRLRPRPLHKSPPNRSRNSRPRFPTLKHRTTTYCRQTLPCQSRSCHCSRRLSYSRTRSTPSRSISGCCITLLEFSASSVVSCSTERISPLTSKSARRHLLESRRSMPSKPSLQST